MGRSSCTLRFGSVLLVASALLLLFSTSSKAFVPQLHHQSNSGTAIHPLHKQQQQTPIALHSFWRRWIPETDFMEVLRPRSTNDDRKDLKQFSPSEDAASATPRSTLVAAAWWLSFLIVFLPPQTGMAVSGGGLDFAGLDISGQDFSNSNYKGKDFTQVIAKGTKFAKSNLQGCRFYKAYLVSKRKLESNINPLGL